MNRIREPEERRWNIFEDYGYLRVYPGREDEMKNQMFVQLMKEGMEVTFNDRKRPLEIKNITVWTKEEEGKQGIINFFKAKLEGNRGGQYQLRWVEPGSGIGTEKGYGWTLSRIEEHEYTSNDLHKMTLDSITLEEELFGDYLPLEHHSFSDEVKRIIYKGIKWQRDRFRNTFIREEDFRDYMNTLEVMTYWYNHDPTQLEIETLAEEEALGAVIDHAIEWEDSPLTEDEKEKLKDAGLY